MPGARHDELLVAIAAALLVPAAIGLSAAAYRPAPSFLPRISLVDNTHVRVRRAGRALRMALPTGSHDVRPTARGAVPVARSTPAAPEAQPILDHPFGTGAQPASRYYPYGSTAHGRYLLHRGLDFEQTRGTPVLAMADGMVIFARPDGARPTYGRLWPDGQQPAYRPPSWGPMPNFYGNLVVIQHAPWRGVALYTLYAHLDTIYVRPGQSVDPGQPVGEVGSTGIALGAHLHMEVRAGGLEYSDTRNPVLWMRPRTGHGTVVGRVLDELGQHAYGRPVQVSSLGNGSPEWVLRTDTYVSPEVKSDRAWRENFAIPDLPAGRYRLQTDVGGRLSSDIVIQPAEVTLVVLAPTTPSQSSGD